MLIMREILFHSQYLTERIQELTVSCIDVQGLFRIKASPIQKILQNVESVNDWC